MTTDQPFAPEWDTLLTIPGANWMASLQLYLKLDGADLDLERLAEQLLDNDVLDALDVAIDVGKPREWSARQAHHALDHLRHDDYILAWPLLGTAVEGMYWEEAETKGLVDPTTAKILEGKLVGRVARDAHDIFRTLPMNEHVQRALSRYAFGSEANAFRHGRRGQWGERHQCAIWLLALITWLDGAGWRHFDSSKLTPPR